MKLIGVFLVLATMQQCNLIPEHRYVKVGESLSNYDLNEFAEEIKLPPLLDEISGLAFDDSTGRVLAINDESGVIYFVNLESKEIDESVIFSGMGDYEGIETYGDHIYISKSNGDLIQFNIHNKSVVEIKTLLRSANDIEGLGKHGNALLLACKAKTSLKGVKEVKKAKATYRYDIQAQKLDEEIYLLITDDMIVEFLQNYPEITRKMIDRAIAFSPSAIAVHPLTKEIFLLSDEGKLLIVTGEDSGIKEIHFLNKSHHFKPEGICFTADQQLLISNEGKHRRGRIFVYDKK
ncbi:MAG: hypothetical protein HKN92_07065 [Chitinophagales bacterium]|nr:hypothetical protein [Chitinophagales bacterium]